MSADLLAAFGHPSDHQAASPETSRLPNRTVQQSLFKPTNDGNDVLFDADDQTSDGDEFGDFEDVRQEEPSQGAEKPQDSIPGSSTKPDIRPEAPLIDLLGEDDQQPPSSAPAPTPGVVPLAWTTVTDSGLPRREDGGIAGNLADNGWDDFADFQQPQSQDPRSQPSLPVESLSLSQLTTAPSAEAAEDNKSRHPTKQRLKPQPGVAENQPSVAGHKKTSSTTSEVVTPWKPVLVPNSRSSPRVSSKAQPEPEPESELEENWADFEDMPPEGASIHSPVKDSTTIVQARTSPKAPPARPTNVPPPSLLLSFLPTTFLGLLDSKDGPSEIIGTFRVASRVIAGRSLRWKRDTLLSQSTRIAAAGRPGGMKLASMNKSENLAEEREAAELVQVWNRNLAKLQAALGRDKVTVRAGAGLGLRLATNIAVKTATGPAILEARVACALCGLKRNERTTGVDDNTEDVTSEMGLSYNEYLNSAKVFGCRNCKTHLADFDDIISRNFRGQHGKAFLFSSVVNVRQGEAMERNMTTGRHIVRDIICKQCGETVGWKYDKAYEASEKYKENKFILESELLCTVT
ncbi:hypothetical protein DV738_g675, partial [Chaetothyriales sp. CBS 135597]